MASRPFAGTTAAILAGGLGTRLRTVVADRPKVLAEVNGRPFILYLLDQLDAAGVRRCVLCTGYRAAQIEQLLGASYRSMAIAYSREHEPLGTGGALRLAAPLLTSEQVLVLNGDSFCGADLEAFLAAHRARGARATLLVAEVEATDRFGSVALAADDTVIRFVEKSAGGGPGWVNAGAYLIERRLLDEIPSDRALSLERDLFPAWIGRGLAGFRGGRRFLDIGTADSFQAAQSFFRQRFVLLDRDGTLMVEHGHLVDPARVELLAGVGPSLRRLRELAFGLCLVTNQSVIGRGLAGMETVAAVHGRLGELLGAEGARLDGIYVCPHTEADGCACRKPRPGLVERAAAELGFDPSRSVVIGDKPCDIDLGRAVGARTVLVRTGYGRHFVPTVQADAVVDDLPAAVQLMTESGFLPADADRNGMVAPEINRPAHG